MKRFAILGVAGYIAPRHLQAIWDVGGEVVAVCDPCDSVGLLDSFGYDIRYHRNESEFWKDVDGEDVDYVAICTPNYLHKEHVVHGLVAGCDVICEKPLVLSEAELEEVRTAEMATNHNSFAVLQMRLHPEAAELKAKYNAGYCKADLRYTTPRGSWYGSSWKGDSEKSGGLLMNIGVHLFDLLLWVFGPVKSWEVSSVSPKSVSGNLRLDRAEIEWFLSIDSRFGHAPSRTLRTEDGLFDFTVGFANLHSEVYRKILADEGFGTGDVMASISLVEKMNNDSRISLR